MSAAARRDTIIIVSSYNATEAELEELVAKFTLAVEGALKPQT
jgi:hypothetical protein